MRGWPSLDHENFTSDGKAETTSQGRWILSPAFDEISGLALVFKIGA